MPVPDLQSYVQLAPDSTGKKVSNITLQAYVWNSTTSQYELQTLYMQVAAIADSKGNVINEFVDYEFQAEQIRLLKQIRDYLAAMNNELPED